MFYFLFQVLDSSYICQSHIIKQYLKYYCCLLQSVKHTTSLTVLYFLGLDFKPTHLLSLLGIHILQLL